MSTSTLAILALGLIFVVSLINFGNELYYRKRPSVLGIILLACFCYLSWYLHTLNVGYLELIEQLSKYQPVKIPEGN